MCINMYKITAALAYHTYATSSLRSGCMMLTVGYAKQAAL
jgi:hypothetical protein